jgi:hypothetical protein
MSADGNIQTVVVDGGQIYVSTDIGNTWVPKESNRDWQSVAMSADGTIQTAVVYNGKIYVSTDTGNSWMEKESNRLWQSAAMSADGNIQTVVVDGGQIYVSTDTGNTWTPQESNRLWQSTAMSADGKVQTAVVDEGQIYVSNIEVDIDGKVKALAFKGVPWRSPMWTISGAVGVFPVFENTNQAARSYKIPFSVTIEGVVISIGSLSPTVEQKEIRLLVDGTVEGTTGVILLDPDNESQIAPFLVPVNTSLGSILRVELNSGSALELDVWLYGRTNE